MDISGISSNSKWLSLSSVLELMQNYIDMADNWSLDIKISDELLQLTRAVSEKHTLLGEKKCLNIAFPSQRECCVVQWFSGTKSPYGE